MVERVLDRPILLQRDLLRVRDRLDLLLVRDLMYFRGLERALLDLEQDTIQNTLDRKQQFELKTVLNKIVKKFLR